MKTIQLSLETAKAMYNSTENSLQKLALDNYTREELTKKELPKKWEDLESIEGYYSDRSAKVFWAGTCNLEDKNKDVFPTKELAEASIAMAQLSQLMAVYNDGWVPDWYSKTTKYCIYSHNCELSVNAHQDTQRFLTFKSRDIATKFLENFKDLIIQAKPLL